MRRTTLVALAAITLYAAILLVEQIRSDEPFDAISLTVDIFEVILLAGAVFLTVVASNDARELRREHEGFLRDLSFARSESAKWRETARNHIDGISHAIAEQFRAWDLTEAEADVAGFILKGMSHKEIATLRDCAEATVRQHATAVYRKSGMGNRAQLTGFFLEDLLAPDHTDRVPRQLAQHDRRA